MKENFENKEEQGFSKGGFEELRSSFSSDGFGSFSTEEKEDKSDGRAWYERDSNEPAWYESESFSTKIAEKLAEEKPEHKPHAMLEEHAKHAHSFPDEDGVNAFESGKYGRSLDKDGANAFESGKYGRSLDKDGANAFESEKYGNSFPDKQKLPVNSRSDGDDGRGFGRQNFEAADGKVYLPNPPPKFLSDDIAYPSGYIAENFKTNKEVNAAKKGANSAFLGIGIVFTIISLFILMGNNTGILFFVFLAIGIVFIGKGAVKQYKSENFALVKPYAVIAESSGEKSDGGVGLRVFYMWNGERREAVTKKIYTNEQVRILTESFRNGTLIVACKKNNESYSDGVAVVCSPDVL